MGGAQPEAWQALILFRIGDSSGTRGWNFQTVARRIFFELFSGPWSPIPDSSAALARGCGHATRRPARGSGASEAPRDGLSSPAMLTLDQLRSNRDALFWTLHAAGWAAYGVAQYFGALLIEKPLEYQLVIGIAAVAGFVLSMPMRYIYRALWASRSRSVIVSVLVTCYVIALALRVVINVSYKWLVEPDWQFRTMFEIFGGALSTMYLLLCWSALYFGIKYYESLQKQREAALRSAALAQEAQLKMLRYQLNPHFLFNTLNAISTLILDNQNRTANHAVTRLSEFLRYTLDQDPMKKVTLRQEIEALDLYMNTERLRFGEPPAARVRGRGAGARCAGAEPAAAAADRKRREIRHFAARRGRLDPHRRPGARRDARGHGDRRRPGPARRQCADRRPRRRPAQHARAPDRAVW